MSLIRIDIADFRNISAITFEPLADGFNLLHGYNGSGKTSILEAIYYLGLGRSFRSSLVKRIIRDEAEKFTLFAHFSPLAQQQIIPIGMERSLQGESKIRIAGSDVRSLASVADLIPVQLINSHCYSLLEGGPLFRRKYLDWGAFHQHSHFLPLWKEVRQLLKQRNAVLKAHRSVKELAIWTEELIPKALKLHELRCQYLQQLLPVLNEMVAELLPNLGTDLQISYQCGWDKTMNYAEALAASIERDFQLGYTQLGPHRADLRLALNKVPAKDILSRGQQKLFVCAMILAQGKLLSSCTNKQPIYLIDDLPSELDARSRSKLIALLSQQQTQVFVTAVDQEIFKANDPEIQLKMFHVEHGKIRK